MDSTTLLQIGIVLGLVIWFSPIVIAVRRKHQHPYLIFLMTCFGPVLCPLTLWWALKGKTHAAMTSAASPQPDECSPSAGQGGGL